MAIVSQSPSVSEVKTALAETSNSVGGLCTSSKINKWSKWKPVRHATRGDITLAEIKNVNFGFSIPSSTNNDYTIALQEWTYNKPRGGAFNEWYRLGDFRGYYRNAVEPLYIRNPIAFNALNNTVVFTLETELMQSSAIQIGIDDFIGEIGNSFFGVIMKSPNNQLFIKTANSSISTRNSTITIPANTAPFNFNEVGLYFVLSSERVDDVTDLSTLGFIKLMSVPSNTRFYQVPIINEINQLLEVSFLEVSRTSSGGFTGISNYYSPNGSYFKSRGEGDAFFKIRIKNNDSEIVVVDKSKIRMGLTKLVDGSVSNITYEPLMYNTSGGAINSVSIQPQQSVDVVVGYNGMFTNKGDTLVLPDTKTDTKVKLQYAYSLGIFRDWKESASILISS